MLSFSPATRISKNSSRFEDTMVMKRSRSRSGTASSAACASTRRLKARMPSSRLTKCAERLHGFARQSVRAVGTNALRVAKNGSAFLREARAVLGFPIEVISGREEARLIYLGVAHSLPASSARRLVLDIGGGSTELIIGTGVQPRLTESLYLGCVSSRF